jgi:Mn2+/Fe2+ NRAMP family transporter
MNDAWAQEWTTLQNQHEAYEGRGLVIKLLAVVLVASGVVLSLSAPVVAMAVLILWAQEAIMKTWQARLGARLLVVEAVLGGHATGTMQPFQLHTQWQGQRAGTVTLLLEYAKSALRPTVAFPYALLVVLSIYL